MRDAPYFIPADEWDPIAAPADPAWTAGWAFAKPLELTNPVDHERTAPVEVEVEIRADQVTDLARELRVAAIGDDGSWVEVPSQVHGDEIEDDVRHARVFFLADLPAGATKGYRILHGNPAAPAPAYDTDLSAQGQDWALTIHNRHYRVDLAQTMGQIQRVAFRHDGADGTVLGKVETVPWTGHGLEGTIHHNPDWSDAHTGRYRLTWWPRPPHFEVIRGPVCVRLRRWGHPILAIGPGHGRSDKVVARVDYTFWAGQPYILMESCLEVIDDVRFLDCRNDEWATIGRDLTQIAWRLPEGEIGFGEAHWRRQEPDWMSFYSEETGEGFATIHLDAGCSHPDWHAPHTVAVNGQWGGLWVRYPLVDAQLRAGDVVRERNAYLLYGWHAGGPDQGFGELTAASQALRQPPVDRKPALAGGRPLTEAHVRDALRGCQDPEVYVRRDRAELHRRRLGLVDLGWVRDVSIVGQDVQIQLIQPYPARAFANPLFEERAEAAIRARCADVGRVRFEWVQSPPWSPQDMTARGRRTMGLDAAAGGDA